MRAERLIAILMALQRAQALTAGELAQRLSVSVRTIFRDIDALSTMAVEPIQYLVVPRVLAAAIMVPLLTSLFTGCGFIGSYAMAVLREGIDPGVFLYETWLALDPPDFYEGYIKSLFFGVQIAIISCFKGFYTSGGARGVGEAATAAVVLSSLSVLVGTYILTELLHPILWGYLDFSAMP